MNQERGRRIAALFDRAADLDAAARERLLAEECRGDDALRAEVEALLAADAGEVAQALDEASTASLRGARQRRSVVSAFSTAGRCLPYASPTAPYSTTRTAVPSTQTAMR